MCFKVGRRIVIDSSTVSESFLHHTGNMQHLLEQYSSHIDVHAEPMKTLQP